MSNLQNRKSTAGKTVGFEPELRKYNMRKEKGLHQVTFLARVKAEVTSLLCWLRYTGPLLTDCCESSNFGKTGMFGDFPVF